MKSLKQKIKMAMIQKDITGGDIARAAGVHRSYIWHVVYGTFKAPRIRRAICDALDLPMSIWDEMDEKKAA